MNTGVGCYFLLQGIFLDLPDPGIEPWSPALQADSLQSEPPGKPVLSCFHLFSNCAELLRDILLKQSKDSTGRANQTLKMALGVLFKCKQFFPALSYAQL